MTDLDLKGLEAVKRAVQEYLWHRGESPDRILYSGVPLWETHMPAMSAAIHAYLAALPAVSEPVAWEGYWPGAGSIDSVTRFTKFRNTMEQWRREGAEITPLYEALPNVSALQARVRELEEELARRDMQLEASCKVALELSNALEINRAALAPSKPQLGL